MYICESGHEEIVHESYRDCPLCKANKEIEELNNDISDLKDKIVTMENDLEEAQATIDDLNKKAF